MANPVPITPVLLTPGQYYAASSPSGMQPASGDSGNFSGPFLIEEQSLNYNYCRVPEALWVSATYGLSSFAQAFAVGQTLLALQCYADYTRRKSLEVFDTEKWQQNQRFKVMSVSADPYGNQYGSVSGGTFGPAGAVVTTQKYYVRRPWKDSDTEVTRTAHGFNFYMSDSLAPYILQVPRAANGVSQVRAMNNFYPFVTHSWQPGSQQPGGHGEWNTVLPGGPQGVLHGGDSYAVWDMGWLGQKTGPWTPRQDTTTDVYIVTDALGVMVKDSKLVRDAAAGNVLNSHLNGYKENHEGFQEYNPDRHTWT